MPDVFLGPFFSLNETHNEKEIARNSSSKLIECIASERKENPTPSCYLWPTESFKIERDLQLDPVRKPQFTISCVFCQYLVEQFIRWVSCLIETCRRISKYKEKESTFHSHQIDDCSHNPQWTSGVNDVKVKKIKRWSEAIIKDHQCERHYWFVSLIDSHQIIMFTDMLHQSSSIQSTIIFLFFFNSLAQLCKSIFENFLGETIAKESTDDCHEGIPRYDWPANIYNSKCKYFPIVKIKISIQPKKMKVIVWFIFIN